MTLREQIDQLKALAESATPGQWGAVSITEHNTLITAPKANIAGRIPKRSDAAFIAAANPQIMLKLLELIDGIAGALSAMACNCGDYLAIYNEHKHLCPYGRAQHWLAKLDEEVK